MARYYRRYRRYRPRRYVRRWFRRRFRRYVNGSSKSNIRMKTAVEASGTLSVPNSNTLSSVVPVTAFANVPTAGGGTSALASPLYRTYCGLYEECKCIGMKVNISIASQIGAAALPSLQIYTAWDRRHGFSEPAYSATEIKNSATYNVATALNNNVAKLTRSIYASDLMERAQWHDCSIKTISSDYYDDAYYTAAANPNFFAPSLFFCFGSPSLDNDHQAPATVAYQLSIVYYFAFRNPKFGASAGSSKLVNLGGAFSGIDSDDGDIDDPNGAVANLAAAAAVANVDSMDDDTRVLEPVAAAASTASQTTKTRARKAAESRVDPRLSARPPPN